MPGNMEFRGENRSYGALITYSLGKAKDEKESKESKRTDQKRKKTSRLKSGYKDGKVMRTLKGPKKPGLNRISWDLRHEAFKTISSPFGGFFVPSEPYVLPGTYKARINLDGDIVEQSFQVHPDQRTEITDQDRKTKYDLIMTNGKYTEALTEVNQQINKSSKAVVEVLSKLDQFPADKQEIVESTGNTIKGRLKAFSHQIAPPKDRSGIFEEIELESQLTGLGYRLEKSFDAPTAGQRAEFKRLKAKTKEIISQINHFFP